MSFCTSYLVIWVEVLNQMFPFLSSMTDFILFSISPDVVSNRLISWV